MARKLPLGDEFLRLLKLQYRKEKSEGRLQLLTPVERLWYRFQSEFRQFTVSTLRWPGDEEYTILSREISYGKCQPLYGKQNYAQLVVPQPKWTVPGIELDPAFASDLAEFLKAHSLEKRISIIPNPSDRGFHRVHTS
ncbi:uncharacterized protein MCYG_07955 [Microsporum canis CBS 113480]|uniref:Uncharacterized protein n=1 Tax=Arthroderma otae (strain ATCC MYA-4605 / CBS 113480) TaxID=554155 RepID=C5FZ33_ARTOC|nr:uncharacterized protein MCYG_07955 [Microsporum canis CBS 113480]EEQ35136.1 predicted protein [Microsporum canis CBS 113480]